MRKILGFIFFALSAIAAAAQEATPLSKAVPDSIVSIRRSIRVSSTATKALTTWRRWEEKTGIKVLDADFVFFARSGFFVSEDGVIVTDASAIADWYLEDSRAAAIKAFTDSMEKSDAPFLSPGDRTSLISDFKAMAVSAPASIDAFCGNKELGAVEVLSNDGQGPVLAQVAGKGFKPLRLVPASAPPPRFKDPVSAAGAVMSPFKPPRIGIETGTISLAKGTTLAFSFPVGESLVGAPLLDAKGDVIGCLAANRSSSGSQAAYAVSTAVIRDALARAGKSGLLTWNGHLPGLLGLDAGIVLNASGEIDASPSVIVDAGANAAVSLNGADAGTGRTALTLSQGLSELKVTWPAGGEFTAKLRLRSALPGPTLIAPAISDIPAPVAIRAAPDGCLVWLDGKFAGTTPIEASLVPGEYRLVAAKPGFWFANSRLSVASGQRTETTLSGETATELALMNLPADAALKFTSDRGEYVPPPGEKVFLPPGDWTLAIGGNTAFENSSVPIIVRKAPLVVDVNGYRHMAKLRVIGLGEKARIWVDEKPVPNPKSEFLTLPVGKHQVFIWEDGYEPLDAASIGVRADGSAFILFPRAKSHELKGKALRGRATLEGIAGAVLTIGGGMLFMHESSPANSGGGSGRSYDPDYDGASDDQKALAALSLIPFGIGIGLDVFASINGYQAGREIAEHGKQLDRLHRLEALNE